MQLKAIKILVKKEIKDSIMNPFLYIVCGLFSLVMGWLFFNYLLSSRDLSTVNIREQVITPFFGNLNFVFLFICPLITMQSFSEESKSGTLDQLISSKLSLSDIIWGKIISSMFVVLMLVFLTLIHLTILFNSGFNDWGIVFTAYVGIILSTLSYVFVGCFFSSLTENMFVASLMTFTFLMGSMLLVISVNSTQNVMLGMMIQYLSIPIHYEPFAKGVLRSYDLVFFMSFYLLFFLMIKKSLEARKW